MSTVFERTDPTAGLELVTGQETSLDATRHLFLAPDLLDPNRRREIDLPQGGEELPNRCLRRTSGMLPRCEITPLEFWGEPLPLELFPDGVRPYKLKDVEMPAVDFSMRGGFNPRLLDKPLFFMPLYPGDLIVDATGQSNGEQRGIVEIEVLRGENYGGVDREMQSLFFDDFVIPIELRLIREHIERVGNSVVDPDVKSVAADMLRSCDQSKEYMEEVVSKASTQLLERVSHQYVHRLTPKLRHFMAQLEIRSPQANVQAVTERVADTAVQHGISAEQLEQILSRVLGELTKPAVSTPEEAPGAGTPAE